MFATNNREMPATRKREPTVIRHRNQFIPGFPAPEFLRMLLRPADTLLSQILADNLG